VFINLFFSGAPMWTIPSQYRRLHFG